MSGYPPPAPGLSAAPNPYAQNVSAQFLQQVQRAQQDAALRHLSPHQLALLHQHPMPPPSPAAPPGPPKEQEYIPRPASQIPPVAHPVFSPSYVYFQRLPSQFSKSTLEKTTACKLKIEHIYRKAVEEAIERNQR